MTEEITPGDKFKGYPVIVCRVCKHRQKYHDDRTRCPKCGVSYTKILSSVDEKSV